MRFGLFQSWYIDLRTRQPSVNCIRHMVSVWDPLYKISHKTSASHIRPYPVENWASRPICLTQATVGQISSWVGDDQRIPAVVCFSFLTFVFLVFCGTLNLDRLPLCYCTVYILQGHYYCCWGHSARYTSPFVTLRFALAFFLVTVVEVVTEPARQEVWCKCKAVY